MANYQFKFDNQTNIGGAFSGIGCMLMGILTVVAGYFIIKGLYWFLYFLTPVLLVAALIINWKVVAGFGQSLWNLLTRNPLGGLLAVGLTVVAFPFVALFIFLTALGSKKLEKLKTEMGKQMAGNVETDGEYVDYEEVKTEDATWEEVKPIEPSALPEKVERPKKQEGKRPENPYDDMFKEN